MHKILKKIEVKTNKYIVLQLYYLSTMLQIININNDYTLSQLRLISFRTNLILKHISTTIRVVLKCIN